MTRSRFYRLDGHQAVSCDSSEWGRWMQASVRHVGETTIGTLWVSTVFLGVDHSFSDKGPPILFETMIFARDSEQLGSELYSTRCSTWDEAEAMHVIAVAWAEGLVRDADEAVRGYLRPVAQEIVDMVEAIGRDPGKRSPPAKKEDTT